MALLLCLVFIWACNEENPALESVLNESEFVHHDSLTLLVTKGIYVNHNVPFTGKAFTTYSNGQMASVTTFENGKKHGTDQKWFRDGTLSYEAFYDQGKKDSINRTWWKNGNLRSESQFKQGVADGAQWQWYKSGSKFKKRQLANGREEGIQQSWRENGKLYNNYEAKNGRIFGLKRASLCYELDNEEVQYED